MKDKILPFLWFNLLLLFFTCLPSEYTWGQCNGPAEQVLHISGTETVGCTEVTVTPFGSAENFSGPPCFVGPHGCGLNGSGGFTFSFSPPVAGVAIDVFTLNNNNGDVEEMVVDVNGGFHAFIDPGIPDPCHPEAIIWPPGTIRGPVDGVGAWREIPIIESINTLKIENNWVSGFPAGIAVRVFLCCSVCETDVGEIVSSPLSLCPDDSAIVPPSEQTSLEPDDLLQYILFSNLNDTLGSIIITSNLPEFTFDPTIMQTDVTYYIAAIAGNDLGGTVDLNDPCLDISNAIEVIWHSEPTVAFSVNDPKICVGGCIDVTVDFTGTAPFTLTYTTSSSGPVTETFQGNSGTIQVCTPVDAPLGSWDVEATELTDGFCTCN